MAAPGDVKNIPLGQSVWMRPVGQDPTILIKNRFFETNPVNQVDQVSFLSRPGLKPFVICGTGPIKTMYTQPGTFSEDMFVVSDTEVYRVSAQSGVATLIGTGLQAGTQRVGMAAEGEISGGTPDMLFIADGRNLWLYIDNGYATGTLTGAPANNDVVRIDTLYYKFTTGSVNAGTPAGTSANPYLIALPSAPQGLANLFAALNLSGSLGVDYSTATHASTVVVPSKLTTTTLQVTATGLGSLGNSIVTTETGAAIAWGSGTLTGGGSTSFTTVQTPDDVGIVDVAFTSNFIIAVCAQGSGVNGRFYWLEPGAVTIDPLNFATAERSPDPVVQVLSVGDQFWLIGTSSAEVWFPSGDPTFPFQRVQGRLFDRGCWGGTAVQIKDAVIVVGRDGRVYNVTDSPQTISTPAIAEQIRSAIQAAEARGILN